MKNITVFLLLATMLFAVGCEGCKLEVVKTGKIDSVEFVACSFNTTDKLVIRWADGDVSIMPYRPPVFITEGSFATLYRRGRQYKLVTEVNND